MISVGIDVSLLIAVIACLVSIAGWLQSGRKAAMAEGKHLQEVNDLKAKVLSLETSMKTVQECYQTTDGDIREIKADMTWVKSALEEIKQSIKGITR